jgi:hypothetical protein
MQLTRVPTIRRFVSLVEQRRETARHQAEARRAKINVWHPKNWAWSAIITALATCVIGGATIWSVIVATGQLRELAATRQQAINSERARFSPSGFTLVRKGDSDAASYVNYGFINMGRSPAVLQAISAECGMLVGNLPIPPVYDPSKFVGLDNAVGPGALIGTDSKPVTLPPCEFDRSIPARVYSGLSSEHLTIRGFIRFRDVYGEVYTQRFGAALHPDGTFHDIAEPSYNAEIKEPTSSD